MGEQIEVPQRPIIRARRIDESDIVAFYASKRTKKPRIPRIFESDEWTLTNTPTGLGDSIILTDLPRAARAANKCATCWSPSPHFRDLAPFNPFHNDWQRPQWVSLSAAQAVWDLGPGHNIQRARRMFDLPVDPIPRGSVTVPGEFRQMRPRVSIHLNAGKHADDQKKRYHPRAREVYPENLDVIRQFIAKHDEVSFFEVGGKTLEDCIPNMDGKPLAEVIREMFSCILHIGIISGPYHLAEAIGIRTICIINFPAPWELMLPTVRNIDVVEAEWLYPQSHILHQDHDSAHWPRFSLESLEAAYYMDVFPYDNPIRYASLVSE